MNKCSRSTLFYENCSFRITSICSFRSLSQSHVIYIYYVFLMNERTKMYYFIYQSRLKTAEIIKIYLLMCK